MSAVHLHVTFRAPSMTASVTSIPSAQVLENAQPRFLVPVVAGDPTWELAAAEEARGGVEADIRIFLDAQLGSGDVVVDVSAGFGFVALSAATVPAGEPWVLVAGISPERVQALQDAAVRVGRWIDQLLPEDEQSVVVLIEQRLGNEGRVFAHVDANETAKWLEQLQPLVENDRLLAVCIGDAAEASAWPMTAAALSDAGFVPCQLFEQGGEPVVLPVTDTPTASVIALPRALIASNITDNSSGPDQQGRRCSSWSPMTDGLVFTAPHSRTGYGVVGANLLQALQARGVLVAFRPLGPVNRTLATNPSLDTALQTKPSATMPSVLLSQQFMLMDHVGAGPRVGFTIFELDRFTAEEYRQMQAQDALVVCSEWARQVCRVNGLTVPVHVVPLGVDRRVFHEKVEPEERSSDTIFMQVGKLEARKGQLELLRAFEEAFTPADPVRLMLHCRNPFVSEAEFEAQVAAFRASPMRDRISIMSMELASSADVARLMAIADCGVFAVRAEGWNLEALEMLSLGKAVIATDVTGHTEFLTSKNARLISIDGMEPAPKASTGAWAAWGPRQHEQLVEHLRAVHTERQVGTLAFNEAGIETAKRFSWEAAAEALLTVLKNL